MNSDKHNWNPDPFGGTCCVRCGCSMFDLFHELSERSKLPCPGRTKPLFPICEDQQIKQEG